MQALATHLADSPDLFSRVSGFLHCNRATTQGNHHARNGAGSLAQTARSRRQNSTRLCNGRHRLASMRFQIGQATCSTRPTAICTTTACGSNLPRCQPKRRTGSLALRTAASKHRPGTQRHETRSPRLYVQPGNSGNGCGSLDMVERVRTHCGQTRTSERQPASAPRDGACGYEYWSWLMALSYHADQVDAARCRGGVRTQTAIATCQSGISSMRRWLRLFVPLDFGQWLLRQYGATYGG